MGTQNSGDNFISNQGNGNSFHQSVNYGGSSLSSLTPEQLRREELLAKRTIKNQKKERRKKFIIAFSVTISLILISVLSYYYFNEEISLSNLILAFSPSMLSWAIPLFLPSILAVFSGAYTVQVVKPTRAEHESRMQIDEINNLYKRKGLTSSDIRKLKKEIVEDL